MITGKLIGEELRALRNKKNFTIEYVAKELDIHPNTLTKYEKTADDCKVETFLKLLDFYETNELIFFKVIRDYNHI